jgi:hypothetical protein
MLGRAIFTIEASRTTINWAIAITTSARQRLGSGAESSELSEDLSNCEGGAVLTHFSLKEINDCAPSDAA